MKKQDLFLLLKRSFFSYIIPHTEGEKMQEREILCIDLKSFYASVECAIRGLDPDTTPLVVADIERGEGSIVLAVSPYLKRLGFPSRCRIFELDKTIDLIYAKPRMNTYINYAIEVIDIYLDFISDEDLFVYSIDEAFLDEIGRASCRERV